MKVTKYFKIIFLVSCFITSCESEDINNSQLNFSGKLVEHSVCKETSDLENNDVSQVDYSFDVATNELTLKHINVSFNCCLDSLYCDISLMNDTILIKEFEAVASPCRCYCLYDLDMLVTGIEAKKYTIIIEHYKEYPKIIFDIDLKTTTNGSFNVIKD